MHRFVRSNYPLRSLESLLTYYPDIVGPEDGDVEIADAPLFPIDAVSNIWPSVPIDPYAILRPAEVDHSIADNRNEIV